MTFLASALKEGVSSGALSLEDAQTLLQSAKEQLAGLDRKVAAAEAQRRPGKAAAPAAMAAALRPEIQSAERFLAEHGIAR